MKSILVEPMAKRKRKTSRGPQGFGGPILGLAIAAGIGYYVYKMYKMQKSEVTEPKYPPTSEATLPNTDFLTY